MLDTMRIHYSDKKYYSSFACPLSLLEVLNEACEFYSLSRSEIMRRVVVNGIKILNKRHITPEVVILNSSFNLKGPTKKVFFRCNKELFELMALFSLSNGCSKSSLCVSCLLLSKYLFK